MFKRIILLSSYTHRQLTYLLLHSVLDQHAARTNVTPARYLHGVET